MQLTQNSINALLKETSRAFYLSLRLLPAKARGPLALAYLLARAADTIADSPASDQKKRLELLESYKKAIELPNAVWHPSPIIKPETDSEGLLLNAAPALLKLLDQEEAKFATAIRAVVATLCQGMLWDHELFPEQSKPSKPPSIGLTAQELERYTYLVAGCVGPFWSRVCALSDAKLSHLTQYDELAIEFGKGLQWVNILRDVAKDQQSHRYYLPPISSSYFASNFYAHCRRGLAAINKASAYPLLFPWCYIRHRLAVVLPLIIGLRTLEKLFLQGGPAPGHRTKVARQEVLIWLALGPMIVANNKVLQFILKSLNARAQSALDTLEASQ